MNRPELNFSTKKRSSALIPATCAALAVCAFSLGSVANAQSLSLLQNTTDGLTVFHDDFESYAVTPRPDPRPVDILPADLLILPGNTTPGTTGAALTGTWLAGSNFGNRLQYDEGIVDQANSIDGVASQEGSKFFQISTNLAGQGIQMTGLGVVANSGAGDTIAANFAFNLTTGSTEAFFYLWGGPSQDVLLAAFVLNGVGSRGTNYNLLSHDGAGFQETGIAFAPDQ